MRATNHSSREWGLARHNDRDFDIEKADHIDPGKQDENYYWNYYGDQELTFQQAELRFYEEAFQGMLQDINARAIASRHKERCKDAIDLLKGRTTCPEEIIYQIGDKDTHVGRNELAAVFNDFRKWHREKFGQHIIPLDYSLHMDEQTPHIHLRQVWIYQNPAGFRAIGQERALKEMGYELPDPGKKEGRNNNRKMVYTRECRQKWLEICREKGIEVEIEPEHRAPNKQNLRKGEYIIQMQEEAFEKIKEGQKVDFYKEMAVTDTMTGVYNRSAFEEWEQETSDYEGYSIVTFDLNNLKWCNDNLGHAAGDAYIQASARIIKEIFGRHGKCYRIGGDEFCTVINQKQKSFDIGRHVKQLRELEKYTEEELGIKDLNVQIACGYAEYDIKTDKNFEDTRSRADKRMYESKRRLKRE